MKLQAFNFIKKRLLHMCFPVNIAKFLGTPVLKNICEGLLLYARCWYFQYFINAFSFFFLLLILQLKFLWLLNSLSLLTDIAHISDSGHITDITRINVFAIITEINPSQLTFTCSKSTIETLENGVKYVQS